jgi:hypothetical protein
VRIFLVAILILGGCDVGSVTPGPNVGGTPPDASNGGNNTNNNNNNNNNNGSNTGSNTGSNNGTGPGQAFTTMVKPLFQADTCLNCHSGAQAPDLTSYMTAMAALTGGANCQVITTAGPGKGHFAALTATDITAIEAWQTQYNVQ